MSILDSLAASIGGEGAAGGNLLQAAAGLLESQGGISGLLEKFQHGGLGEVVQSWIATGANLPISAEQIQNVLGSEALAPLAEKFGLDPQSAASSIATYLPQLVDQLTPNGQIEGEGGAAGLLEAGMGLLKGKLFG